MKVLMGKEAEVFKSVILALRDREHAEELARVYPGSQRRQEATAEHKKLLDVLDQAAVDLGEPIYIEKNRR